MSKDLLQLSHLNDKGNKKNQLGIQVWLQLWMVNLFFHFLWIIFASGKNEKKVKRSNNVLFKGLPSILLNNTFLPSSASTSIQLKAEIALSYEPFVAIRFRRMIQHDSPPESLSILLFPQSKQFINPELKNAGHSRGIMHCQCLCQNSCSIHNYVVPILCVYMYCTTVHTDCDCTVYSCLVDRSEHHVHPGDTTHDTHKTQTNSNVELGFPD